MQLITWMYIQNIQMPEQPTTTIARDTVPSHWLCSVPLLQSSFDSIIPKVDLYKCKVNVGEHTEEYW